MAVIAFFVGLFAQVEMVLIACFDGLFALFRPSASAASEPRPLASASSSDATQDRQQIDVGPLLERTNVVHSIFLSHSGVQKGFVERLYECLKNAGYNPFFDQESILRGTPFPESIRYAATETEVGVVILSDDFMSSKWPMLELEILMSSTKVMPLFYKLSPADLKSPKKLSEWKKKWSKMAREDRGIDVSRWENAVKCLATQAGEVYRSGASEGEYIKKVVKAICKKLRPHINYDLSYAKGQQRFIEEVEAQFQNTPIVGMHGVGGLGKTTLCKVMVNFYMPHYCGKCAIIEFPMDKSAVSIIKECKRALKQLTCASEDLLEDVHDFDEVVQLMKERMRSEAVFLALDNVWHHSEEEARRILDVGLGADSKVLVTSRSEALLENLLDKVLVRPLITVNEREAIETFRASFGTDLSFASRELLGGVVSLCLFNGSYHPLALKALGRRLNTMGGQNPCAIEENLRRITFTLRSSNLEDVIRINYDGMKSIAQRMFLDVAVVFRHTRSFFDTFEEMGYKEMCDLLSILYEGECDDDEIKIEMNLLALNGLLQIEEEKDFLDRLIEDFKRKVVVHDLYVELAEHLAAGSPRILVVAGSTNMEAVRWAELERVVWDSKREDAVKFLVQEDCPKLQILYASEQTFSKEEGLQLKRARALRLLKVRNCIGRLSGLKAVPKLAVLHVHASEDVEVQPEARAGYRAIQDISSCRELKGLVLDGEAIFDGAEDDAGYFCPLTNLKYLELQGWVGLKNLRDLTASVHLQHLCIGRSQSLEEIEGGMFPPRLEIIGFENCARLRRVQGLGCCGQLRNLLIVGSELLEEIQGLPPNLHLIMLDYLPRLQRIPDLGMQAQLQALQVHGCGSLKEIRGVLTSNLEVIDVNNCSRLQRMPDLDGQAQLRELWVSRCGSLEEIPGILPRNLEKILLYDLPSLQGIPNLGGRVHLRAVDVQKCGSLVEDQVWGNVWCSLE